MAISAKLRGRTERRIDEAAHQITVMRAFLNGEPIQYKVRSYATWLDVDPERDLWHWEELIYRVKPK